MPGFLLHVGATVLCSHAGQAQPTSPNPRVKVGGQPVVTQAAPYTVAGCPFVSGTVPTPCVTATWLTASLRVRAGGMPVLLQDSQSMSVPNGTPLSVVMTQVRVKGQ